MLAIAVEHQPSNLALVQGIKMADSLMLNVL